MLKGLLLAAALFALGAQAKLKHLLPLPQQVERVEAAPFALGRPVALTDPTHTALLRHFLRAQGCSFAPNAAAQVVVRIEPHFDTFDYRLDGFPNEGYRLRVRPDTLEITAATKVGIIRAAQTLAQMAMGGAERPALEAADITDFPAFKLRGFMHDVGRSFLSIETLKRHIDLLSRFKVNTFHWHLTENQAWRIEVKAFPQLTAAEHMTRFPGRFYTQAEAQELETFAAERGVIIIPEIDMPGHSEAFRRAMGFDMQTDAGVAALTTILEEMAAVFPRALYLHIGADERASTYPRFLETMIDKVHALGRKVVVWNPVQGVNIGGLDIDMTQMWSTAGKAVAGKPNIDCRYQYTNHFDVFADLVGIYKSNIYYAERGHPDLAGTISAPWNDRKMATERDIVAQNNFFANAIALAERSWRGGGRQYVEQGGTTLPDAGAEWEEFRSWEERFLFHKSTTLAEEPVPYVRQTDVRWCITEPFPNEGDPDRPLPPETEGLKDSYVYHGKTYRTGHAIGAGIYLRHTWGSIIPAHFPHPQEHTTAYAWTYIYSPQTQEAGALIELYNYGRSEKDAAPDAGTWDRYGSKIWLNDRPIAPPTFDNSGLTDITHETLLRNENFTARPPLPLRLKKGWNKVLLRLPFLPDGRQRLRKWMFTFVLTDRDGRNALDGIVYAPHPTAEPPTALPLGSR